MTTGSRPKDDGLTGDNIEAMQERMSGSALTPDDRASRNGRRNGRPALLAQCTGTADVVAAALFGGETDVADRQPVADWAVDDVFGFLEPPGELGAPTPTET